MKNNFQVGEKYVIENLERSNLSLGTKIMLYPVTNSKFYKNGNTWNNFPSGTSWMRLYRSGGTPSIMKISFWDSSNNLLSDVSLTDGNFKVYGEFVNLQDNLNQDLPTDSDEYIYIRNHSRQASMHFELCTLNCEPHVVSKTSGTNLLLVDYAFGTPREEFNVLTPSITFEYDSVPNFNYIYIPSLSRYYFVTNITCVRNKIYRVDLKVDVLCTYDLDIRAQDGFVSRNEKDISDNLLLCTEQNDERYQLLIKDLPTIDVAELTNLDTGQEFDCDLDRNDDYCVVVTIQATASSFKTNTGHKTPYTGDTNLPDVGNIMGDSPILVSYGIKYSDWETFCSFLASNDTLLGYVVSAYMFPYKLSSDMNVNAGLKAIYLGTHNTGVSGYWIHGEFSHYRRKVTFNITPRYANGYDNFINYEPYTKREIYLPFHGWETLSLPDIYLNDINVYYVTNYVTGQTQILVYNSTNETLLNVYDAQVGTTLSISTTNRWENDLANARNITNLTLGLLGSGVSMISSATEEKYGGVFGGALKGAGATMSFVLNKMSMVERANTRIGTGQLQYFSPLKFFLRETYHGKIGGGSMSIFAKLNGYKQNVYKSLSSLTGYTEIPNMHYIPSTYKFITKTEIDEIISLAKNGIIL